MRSSRTERAHWLFQLAERHHDLDLLPPGRPDLIDAADRAIGPIPAELRSLLEISNGIVCRSFRVLSVFDPSNPKKTWESLQRFNSPLTSNAMGGDPAYFARFLVFADIGGGYAMFDRNDGSLWFEEVKGREMNRVVCSFREFIEGMIADAE